MRAAALAVDAADVRDAPDSGTARFVIHIARNSYGWGGRAVLIASREGLRFSARRAGFTGYLRPREILFVPSNRIASVLREAAVIRLHVREDGGGETADLEFSAGSAAAAASIVGSLPAAQTVELENAPRPPGAAAPRPSAALWVTGLAVIVVGVAAALLLFEEESPPRPAALPDLPRASLVETESVPTSELLASRSELRAADERTAAMKRKFALELRDLMEGRITQANFTLRLNRDLIPQWRQERGELANRFDRVSTQLTVLHLLGRSADLWAQALELYSEGLREQRPEKVLKAFEGIGQAEALEANAYDLVRRAEQ